MTDTPTASHDGTIERTDDGGVIRFRRLLPYAVDDVWDAITNPARLSDWWLPFDADISVDLRVGGEMVFAGRGDDAPTMTCTILRLEPPTLLEHTHGAEGSFMRWELTGTGTGTGTGDHCELRVSHFVTDVAQAIDGCYAVGLHSSLDRLEPALAGRPAPWDWDAFAGLQGRYAARGMAPAPGEAP